MLAQLDPLRGVTLDAVGLRMLLALVCGGLIGIEREYKRRPAGFRTHILICLGAAITTMTSQYLVLVMHYETDVARLGAQVVAGIGFIGAGAIIVTNHQRVKGLTTAAGLWTAAIVGLALGAGFYEGGVCVTFLVMVAEVVLSKLEYLAVKRTREVDLYLAYSDKRCLDETLKYLKMRGIRISDLQITQVEDRGDSVSASAIVTLRLNRKTKLEEISRKINGIEGITAVDELVNL